jgi:hypothetical protein
MGKARRHAGHKRHVARAPYLTMPGHYPIDGSRLVAMNGCYGGSCNRSLAVARPAAVRAQTTVQSQRSIRARYFENDWTWRAHRAWISAGRPPISEPRAASALAGLAGGARGGDGAEKRYPHERGSDHAQDYKGDRHRHDETATTQDRS